MTTRRSRWVRLAVLVALVSACHSTPAGPSLVAPGDPDEVDQLPGKKSGQHWVHGSFIVCLDGPGAVTVDSVKFRTGSLQVAQWLFRPNPASHDHLLAGDLPGTFARHDVRGGHELVQQCSEQSGGYELVLELEANHASSIGRDVVIEYGDGLRTKTLTLDDTVAVCVLPDHPPCFPD
jgi:hypothetical protein